MRQPHRVTFVVSSALILMLAPLAASAQGTIEGTVTFWGDPGGGTQIELAAHSNPFSAPDATVLVSLPTAAFSIPVADGTYYIAALMARDGIFGEPRAEDVLSWYDADADGDQDSVTVNGGAVTGVNIDLGFIYVDADATGGNSGSTWDDAFPDLQDGVTAAPSGVDVWVAEGTYVPGTSRSDSFLPKPGVRVCGGFTGVETIRLERDWNAHPTILSGDIGTIGTHTDNSYHVVRAEGSNPYAVLDGVTISGGYAYGGGDHSYGGGVRALSGGVTITNSIISNNQSQVNGGGISTANPATVIAINSSFTNNHAVMHGGGFYINAASPVPSMTYDCVFTGNTAWRGGGLAVGGQVWDVGTEPILINLSVSGNHAGGEGGGIFTNTTTRPQPPHAPPPFTPVVIINTIVWANTGPIPQISSFGGTDVAEVNYGIVQGGWATGSNILTDDPSFADTELRLNLDSPAIDAGDGSFVPRDPYDADADNYVDGPVQFDRDFNRRWINIPYVPNTGPGDPGGETIDMGAYEAFDPTIVFWDGFEGGSFENWSNIVGEL